MLLLFRPILFPLIGDENAALPVKVGKKRKKILSWFARLGDEPLFIDPKISSRIEAMQQKFAGRLDEIKRELESKRQEEDELSFLLDWLWKH